MKEICKPIPIADYAPRYDISNLGRVRTRAIILSPRIYDKKYFKVNLSTYKKGVRIVKLRAVHRLVAIAFIPNPLEKECINHKDNDKKNNFFKNLEWCSQQENRRHTVFQSRHARGENIASSKLLEWDIKYIRQNYPTLSARSLAIKFKVNINTIRSVARKRTWRHI